MEPTCEPNGFGEATGITNYTTKDRKEDHPNSGENVTKETE